MLLLCGFAFSLCVSLSPPVLGAACIHHHLHPLILPMSFNLTPPVLRFSCRITSRFNVLGQSLMYLNPLVWLVSDLSKFPPRLSLTPFACPQVLFAPQVPTLIQCHRASPHLPCIRRSPPCVSPFVFTLSCLPLLRSLSLPYTHMV